MRVRDFLLTFGELGEYFMTGWDYCLRMDDSWLEFILISVVPLYSIPIVICMLPSLTIRRAAVSSGTPRGRIKLPVRKWGQ